MSTCPDREGDGHPSGNHVPLKLGEIVRGPGYKAKCIRQKVESTGFDPRVGPRFLAVVHGEFVCDPAKAPFGKFDLSKYLPLIGEGFVLETSSQMGSLCEVAFESTGPVSKLKPSKT